MNSCGLEVVDIQPIVRLARYGSTLWRWPEDFFKKYFPIYLERNVIQGKDVEEFWTIWNVRKQDPNAFLILPTCLDVIGKRTT